MMMSEIFLWYASFNKTPSDSETSEEDDVLDEFSDTQCESDNLSEFETDAMEDDPGMSKACCGRASQSWKYHYIHNDIRPS